MKSVFKYELVNDKTAFKASVALGSIKHVMLGSAVLVDDDGIAENIIANIMFDFSGYISNNDITDFDYMMLERNCNYN